MIRELRTPEGGFASALDADSEGQEGLFYTWTPAELAAELGKADGRYAAEIFGVPQAGTFEHGRSVLQLRADPAEPDRFAAVRDVLLAARERRVRPGRDEQSCRGVEWLAIAALAECGCCSATAASPSARPARPTSSPGCTCGAIGWPGPPGPEWPARARVSLRTMPAWPRAACPVRGDRAGRLGQVAGQLLDTALSRFTDGGGAFYDTADDGEALIYRPADPIDGPTPSGHVRRRGRAAELRALTGSARHREAALAALGALGPIARAVSARRGRGPGGGRGRGGRASRDRGGGPGRRPAHSRPS
jgi:uncharacterized protein YyaL (SSP411 family)